MAADTLKGRRILIVEDDYFVAEDLASAFIDEGAGILGPVAEVNATLSMINGADQIDGAVLDINLHGEMVFPVAEELTRRRIPFVFSTGYTRAIVPESYDDVPRCEKPLDPKQVRTALTARIMRREAEKAARHDETARGPNKLLQALSQEDFTALAPALRRVELKSREVLVEENKAIPAVFFPETAVIALLVAARGARPIEVGVVGCEGMTDLIVHPGDVAALRTTVLIGGSALAIDAESFGAALRRPGVNRAVLAYKEALSIQFAYAALSHGTSTIDARLARWILMIHDRIDGDMIPVVHNVIADLLAVRRSGVTTALHVLEGMGAIKSIRGVIIVRDRALLQQLAAGTYGPPEAEYERIMKRSVTKEL